MRSSAEYPHCLALRPQSPYIHNVFFRCFCNVWVVRDLASWDSLDAWQMLIGFFMVPISEAHTFFLGIRFSNLQPELAEHFIFGMLYLFEKCLLAQPQQLQDCDRGGCSRNFPREADLAADLLRARNVLLRNVWQRKQCRKT